MFKKVKARTIIFALIIGIVVVGILGGFYLSMIKEIIQMSNGNVVDIIKQAVEEGLEVVGLEEAGNEIRKRSILCLR